MVIGIVLARGTVTAIGVAARGRSARGLDARVGISVYLAKF